MQRINTGTYTYGNLKDRYGRIENVQILFIAASGEGKGIASAGMTQTFYNEGYTVIAIADPKDECEFAYYDMLDIINDQNTEN